jgi:hypothetical protein
MAGLHEPPCNVRPHPAKADNTELHIAKVSRYALSLEQNGKMHLSKAMGRSNQANQLPGGM